jgi:hypothetical protein
MAIIPKIPIELWANRPAKNDYRDFIYGLKISTPIAENIPRRYINNRLTHRNQLKFGTCGGQAVADAMDLRFGQIMSALFAYMNGKKYDSFPGEEGTDNRSLMKGLQKHGIPLEILFRYSKYKEALVFPEPDNTVIEDASKRKIDTYAKCVTVEEVCDAIYRYNSVIAGFLICSNFKTIGNGFIPLPDGYVEGGHDMDLCGYDMDLEFVYPSGRKCKGFVFSDNSWGEEWGFTGECWIPFDYLIGQSDTVQYAWEMFAPILNVNSTIDNKILDLAPTIVQSRTVAPVRNIAEALGASVNWFSHENRVEIVGNSVKINMYIGSKDYTITKIGDV